MQPAGSPGQGCGAHGSHRQPATWRPPGRRGAALAISRAGCFPGAASGKVGGWSSSGQHPGPGRRSQTGMPMNEQTSGTHGPREDDALKREVRSELQAHRATRAEEWLEPEPPAEDEPEATWAPEGRPGGTPPGEDWDTLELRSDLARHLDRTAFPATRAHLLEVLASHQAEQRLLDLVSTLPGDATYASLAELLPALGLPIEERPA